MLQLRINPDSAQPWSWTSACWVSGSNEVTPYLHPALILHAYTDGDSTLLSVRERTPDSGTATLPRPRYLPAGLYRHAREQCLAAPLDFTVLEHTRSTGTVTLTAGLWGTAPLYLTARTGTLHGSWSLAHLQEHLSLDDLDPAAVARQLTQQLRYSRDTLFRNVQQLTERATATFDGTALHVAYPTPVEHAQPRPLREHVDIVTTYEHELTNAIQQRPLNPENTAVELSGGIDSANVAMSLSRSGGAAISYALAIGGPAGTQQLQRRVELAHHGQFRDFTLPAPSHLPLAPTGARGRGAFVDPTAEPYHEAVHALLTEAHRRGVTVAYTGDGGDELLSLRGPEWDQLGRTPGRHRGNTHPPPWLGPRSREQLHAIDHDNAPPTVVNEATLLGFACRTPQFLEAGIWPVSPLCTPRLIRLCEQLPVIWRDRKRIARERLTRLGFDRAVVRPRRRETFTHLMETGLRRHGGGLLDALLHTGGVLTDCGYVDPDALRVVRNQLDTDGPVPTLVFQVLATECALQALGKNP